MTTHHTHRTSACRVVAGRLFSTLLLSFLLLPFHTAAAFPDSLSQLPDRISHTPDWARDAIWYQIFPERFRNGDTTNDPTRDDVGLSWPFDRPAEWHVSPWTADWYALQPWERAEGKGFYFRVQQRRFGGDLQGVIDKLDYLQDLGVTAIYLNPVFESPSLHKYDATMYHHIDNNFGPDPAGDAKIWATENPADPATWTWTAADKLFLRLLTDAHHRGIHVIIDGVFNHVGTTFWAFRDVRTRGKASPYADWFTVKKWDDPSTAADEFDYSGWIGIKDLPEWREDDQGLVTGPREHVHAVVRRWMDPNGDGDPSDGIDGWRLDVAEMVALPFWRQFRLWARAINPDAYITGEIWWENWNQNKMFNAAPWLRGDAFDAVMNYRWAAEALHFVRDRKNKITASEFAARLDALRADYRPEATAVLMNLYASHDTDRLGSMLVNVDATFDHRVGASDNPDYDVRKPGPSELRQQRLLLLLQMTYVGAPMVYYGEEAGMWGGDDPDERKPMVWSDMTFDPETHHPLGKPRPRDVVSFDSSLHRDYRALMHLRSTEPALRRGTYRVALTDDRQDAFAFERTLGSDRLLVVVNNGAAGTVRVPVTDAVDGVLWKDLRSGESYPVERGNISVPLEAVAGRVLKAVR